MKQYKVVALQDSFMGGRFSEDEVQLVLNSLTPAGWKLVEVVTHSIAGIATASNDQLVLFFEREFQDEITEETEESWICPECKCEVNEGQKLCHNCGEVLE